MQNYFFKRWGLALQLCVGLYAFSLSAQAPLDQDHDGLLDIQETAQGLILDIDQDGLDNHLDLDSDNDGIFDLIEAFDFNGDGKHDQTLEDLMLASQTSTTNAQWETPFLADDDQDGLFNFMDQDDDGDGFLTAWECPSLPCTQTFGQLHYRHIGLFDRDHLWIAVKNQVGAYTGLAIEDETKIYHLGQNQQVIQLTSIIGITATSMTRNPRDGSIWLLDKPPFDEINSGIILSWHPLHGEREVLRLGESANIIAFDDQGILWLINDSEVYSYNPINQSFSPRMPFPLGMNVIALNWQGQSLSQGPLFDWFTLVGGYEALPYPTVNQWITYQRDFSQNQSTTQTSPLFASVTISAQQQIFALSESANNNQIGQNEVNQKEFILSRLDSMFIPTEIDTWLHTGTGNQAIISSMSVWVTDQDQDGLEDLVEEIIVKTSSTQADTDADGVQDGVELKDRKTSALNPFECGDIDMDLCDDCDREGPLGIGGNPLNDGVDTDQDGQCNLSDIDDDQDGVRDEVDAFPLDSTEQSDQDGDGIGDQQDSDDDNDQVQDAMDLNPLSPIICRDIDMDLCDDCALNDVAHGQIGPNPMQDGLDQDMDGLCDQGDDDIDGDGLSNRVEARLGSNPLSQDTDEDGLKDGLEVRRDSTVGSGDDGIVNVDQDQDQIPNILDPDDDNDGINTSMELGDSNQNQIPDYLEIYVGENMMGGSQGGQMGGQMGGNLGGSQGGERPTTEIEGGSQGGERPTTEIEGGSQGGERPTTEIEGGSQGGADLNPIGGEVGGSVNMDETTDQSMEMVTPRKRSTYVESCKQNQSMPTLWAMLIIFFVLLKIYSIKRSK